MILVTGGTGFLGSTLLQYLIEGGKSVVALKRETSTIPSHLKSSSLIQWVDADVTDYFALAEILPKVKQVYHCAAKVSYHPTDAQELFQTNVLGTRYLVNLCLRHGVRLLHVSSIAALGMSKRGKPVNESDLWEKHAKTSNYSLTKYEAEMEVWRGIAEGLDAVIVNPSLIMGVGLGEKGSRVIFDMVHRGNRIYPLGSVGVVDVEDVARIMIRLMNHPVKGERFVLNAENISNQALLTRISQLMNKPAPRIKATPVLMSIAWRMARLASLFSRKPPALTAETARAANRKLEYDNAKIKSTLAYAFKPLDQTLKEVYEAYYSRKTI